MQHLYHYQGCAARTNVWVLIRHYFRDWLATFPTRKNPSAARLASKGSISWEKNATAAKPVPIGSSIIGKVKKSKPTALARRDTGFPQPQHAESVFDMKL